MASNYKPVGGVESCALYPAEAVQTALFSSEGCQATLSGMPVAVMLLDDASHYEEVVESCDGITKISHRLSLVADRGDAAPWLDVDFLERASIEGLVAVVGLANGCSVLVGYSLHFGSEQPLRLQSMTSTSGSKLHDTPTVTLFLTSCDTEFSYEMN